MTEPLSPQLAEPIAATRLVAPARARLRFVRPRSIAVGWPEIYGAIVLALVLAARFVPVARFWPMWGCKFRELTGWPCFSCGMTRSFDWFAQGRWLDSLSVNPLGFLIACTGTALALCLAAAPLRPPRPVVELSPRGCGAMRVAAVAICLLNWAYLLLMTALQSAR